MSKPVLVIGCGRGKLSVSSAVNRLYTGTMWKTYRAARERHEGADWPVRHPRLDVYVLSAKHGLASESKVLAPYEKEAKTESEIKQLADRIRRSSVPDRWPSRVYFAGSGRYYDALSRGLGLHGIEARNLAPLARGSGDQARALKLFLAEYAPQSFDLDALIAKVTR